MGHWSRSARVLAAGLIAGATVAGPIGPTVAAHAVTVECKIQPGVADPGVVPWAQKRLNIAALWPITQGAGVTVAVIDSGVDKGQPQIAQIHYAPGQRLIPGGAGFGDTTDCIGHGTGVTGIIAAPKVEGVAFTGVAPQARILPIEVTNDSSKTIPAGTIAQGIDAAIAAHVQVINISITTTSDLPVLRNAVAAAENAGIVVVAAANESGRNGQQNDPNQPAYPAAYPTVIAVNATDSQDNLANNVGQNPYIDLSAPGVKVETPWPNPSLAQGYYAQNGTSFAAPYVSGVVALVRATHPDLTPAQVRNRLEATADSPPGKNAPDPGYGYGIVNPYLAVTSIRDDSILAAPPAARMSIPLVPPKPPADRHLQHLALATGTGLLGLAVLAALVAAVVRRGSWFGRRGAAPADQPGRSPAG